MKSAHVYKKGESEVEVKIQDLPIPKPEPGQVLIKVIVAGTNPKDWKHPLVIPSASGMNTGDDVAGYIEAVGSDVTEFKAGDRVAAMHEALTAHGAFAEYAIAPEKLTFHLPNGTSFEEGATIPLAAATAVVGVFARLGLPEPWDSDKVSQSRRQAAQGGVLVYGAATAVGAFAIKLLMRTNIHPIIGVAGRGLDFVKEIIDESKGDVAIDYREGDNKLIQGIKNAIPKGGKLMYAFDTVSENGSYQNIVKVLDSQGHISLILPNKKYEGIPESMKMTVTGASSIHGHPDDLSDLGYAWFRLFSLGLKEGWFSGHPYEVIQGGLMGVQIGLDNLKSGKASAIKYVYRIDETEGLQHRT